MNVRRGTAASETRDDAAVGGMRRTRWRAPAVTALALLSTLGLHAPLHAGQLASLAWLAGCWANTKGEPGSGEYWLPLAGGTMLGMARIIRNGKTVDHEFLRLHEDANGTAVYTAIPARQQETAFVATDVHAGGARFENPAHDFPTRIVYTRTGDAAMVVRIEGTRQGKQVGFDFSFTRVACDR